MLTESRSRGKATGTSTDDDDVVYFFFFNHGYSFIRGFEPLYIVVRSWQLPVLKMILRCQEKRRQSLFVHYACYFSVLNMYYENLDGEETAHHLVTTYTFLQSGKLIFLNVVLLKMRWGTLMDLRGKTSRLLETRYGF
jgi:hypothetical protein